LHKKIKVVGTQAFYKLYSKFRESDPSKIKLDEAMDLMKRERINGVYIKRKPWPRKYLKDDLSNLYKYNIDNQRLIYTVRGLANLKYYQILDFLTHKEYNVLFGYD
jgi:hypothetical protein